MPLTTQFARMYNDALIALATATHRPANVVNVAGNYCIRVDFEYNRYLIAGNTGAGLSDQRGSEIWSIRIYEADASSSDDRLLAEASHQWLVDAYDAAWEALEAEGNRIEADADFSDRHRLEGTPAQGVAQDSGSAESPSSVN